MPDVADHEVVSVVSPRPPSSRLYDSSMLLWSKMWTLPAHSTPAWSWSASARRGNASHVSVGHMLQRKHDKVYQWKALRMISRESLPIFAKTAFTNDLEEAARGFFPDEVHSLPRDEFNDLSAVANGG